MNVLQEESKEKLRDVKCQRTLVTEQVLFTVPEKLQLQVIFILQSEK